MPSVHRKVVYRLYPSRSQEAAMLDMLGAHQRLYNAALEQRITAWQRSRTRVGLYTQQHDLAELRAVDDEYAAINSHSARVTLRRLDLAFKAFFRRVKAGETPGFPRFKSFGRFSGWGYEEQGNGYRLFAADRCGGKLRLAGIGTVRMRGKARSVGQVVTCEIQRKSGRWYASFAMKCAPVRDGGTEAVGLDWGVEAFATIAREDGGFEAVPNPRFFARHEAAVVRAAHELDAATEKDAIGRPKNWADPRRIAAKQRLGRAKMREANARKDFLHKTSAALVARAGLIATEALNVTGLTARGGAHKAGLNREILATAPSTFLSMLRYKAEEAGTRFIETPTRTLKPSQRCSDCGIVRKKPLAERMHRCDCGLVLSRDENGARNNLLWALKSLGREPAISAIVA